MGSTPRSARSNLPASAHRVGVLFHHLRSVIDVLEQLAQEELVEVVVPSSPLPRHGGIEGVDSGPEKRSFTIREVTSALGVGRSTIYAAIAQKKLKAVKLGSRTLILRDDLHGWIASFPAR